MRGQTIIKVECVLYASISDGHQPNPIAVHLTTRRESTATPTTVLTVTL